MKDQVYIKMEWCIHCSGLIIMTIISNYREIKLIGIFIPQRVGTQSIKTNQFSKQQFPTHTKGIYRLVFEVPYEGFSLTFQFAGVQVHYVLRGARLPQEPLFHLVQQESSSSPAGSFFCFVFVFEFQVLVVNNKNNFFFP